MYWQANGSGDLIFKIRNNDSDTIIVHNDLSQQSWSISSGVAHVRFADGTSADLGQPAAAVGAPLSFNWFGAANARISGSNYGSNTFELNGGNEAFMGGSGDNTYLASAATGQTTIYANATAGTTKELDFTGGIADENLWFVQSGNDLKIDLMGTNTGVTINNWLSDSSHQLQEITAGGLTIDSQISQLVQAMATYSASHSGFDSTNSSITGVPGDSALQTAIGAAWHEVGIPPITAGDGRRQVRTPVPISTGRATEARLCR